LFCALLRANQKITRFFEELAIRGVHPKFVNSGFGRLYGAFSARRIRRNPAASALDDRPSRAEQFNIY
jgi:hypothetical protein